MFVSDSVSFPGLYNGPDGRAASRYLSAQIWLRMARRISGHRDTSIWLVYYFLVISALRQATSPHHAKRQCEYRQDGSGADYLLVGGGGHRADNVLVCCAEISISRIFRKSRAYGYCIMF